VEAASYAPDVRLAGVAALAPASDVVALAAGLQGNPGGHLFVSFVVEGYSSAYSDVSFDDYVRPTARAVVREAAGRCLSEPAILLSIGAVLPGEDLFQRDLASGPLARRLAENVPARPSGLPSLLAQGAVDTLVLPDAQRRFVARLCAASQAVDFRVYAGRDHVPLVEADSRSSPSCSRGPRRAWRGSRRRRSARRRSAEGVIALQAPPHRSNGPLPSVWGGRARRKRRGARGHPRRHIPMADAEPKWNDRWSTGGWVVCSSLAGAAAVSSSLKAKNDEGRSLGGALRSRSDGTRTRGLRMDSCLRRVPLDAIGRGT
jgi:hypothetical protein